MFSCGACLFFLPKLIKFAYVACLQVTLGGTSSFLTTSVRFSFVFFVLQTVIDIYFVKFNLLCIIVKVILLFLPPFVRADICL